MARHEITRPDLAAMKEKWAQVNVAAATDEELVAAIREMSMAEGNYWTSNASHTFGVAKSTDDHLQCFLREALPEHNFISGPHKAHRAAVIYMMVMTGHTVNSSKKYLWDGII